MELSREQQGLLDGEQGEVTSRLMRLLVSLGDIFGARRMVEVGSTQVSGVSYKSIGEPGLEFLEDLAREGVKVRVPTSLNPAGMDLQGWRELGIPEAFAVKQQQIMDAFRTMGITAPPTCTPYLIGSVPQPGEHVAWAESSAVIFVNSVLGARTNREGGPSALAAAVCGCTPCYGLHLEENRRPTVLVDVDAELNSNADYGALGYALGRKVRGAIPFITGIEGAGRDNLKSLGAAMAASGAVALYHAAGVTPEASTVSTDGLERIRVEQGELDELAAGLDAGETPDLVVTGCPHASLEEVASVAEQVRGRTLRVPVWICTSRVIKERAEGKGYLADIEAAGGRIVADTCMVVSPLEEMDYGVTSVDSGKAANYLPGFCQQKVNFRDLHDIIEEVLE
jgi:predicted aconitase